MECFGTYQARKSTREESNDGFENVEKVSGIKKDVQGIKKEITETDQEFKTTFQLWEKFWVEGQIHCCVKIRGIKLYEVDHANTGRLQNSPVIYMQKLLNGYLWCLWWYWQWIFVLAYICNDYITVNKQDKPQDNPHIKSHKHFLIH